MSGLITTDLIRLLGEQAVIRDSLTRYANDASEYEGLRGIPSLVVTPDSAAQVRQLVQWAYEHDVPLVPRGGGTGFAGGAVPVDGEVVVDVSKLRRVRALDPGFWRMHAEAGLTTATIHRLARENGLYFPPDPGAAEQSQLGGNIATNAGGPHALKYGATGAWVTGIEAVIPPGEVMAVGGPVRKDVAGYDLKNLLVGSEGTLGIITAAWLRLIPAPQSRLPIIAAYDAVGAGCDAIQAIFAAGIVASALEFLEGAAVEATKSAFPLTLPDGAQFLIIAEADGEVDEASRVRRELREALVPDSLEVWLPTGREEAAALWRWREGVARAVAAQRGGKLSEDVAVPVDRLREAVEGTLRIGQSVGLPACSWGHAGDGNLHSTFLIDPGDPTELARAQEGGRLLHELAVRLGGVISGEHGVGWLKRGRLALQWDRPALDLHRQLKRLFDPKNLMNPGKKM
jgi:glycolate oxidase subunit GlcD